MTKAFVIAEHEEAARELCAGARGMADEVTLCMVGGPAVTDAADVCVHVTIPANRIVDDAYLTVNDVFDGEGAQLVLGEASLAIFSLVGRLAAHLETAAVPAPWAIEGQRASCMYYGGTGIRIVCSESPVSLYTFGADVFDPTKAWGGDAVREAKFVDPAIAVEKVGEEMLPKADVDLHAAEVVVGCGSGFASREELQLAYGLAEKIGAEVGCTRPLAEAMGWFPKEAYIGVTGETLFPKVYIAIGVSGQMQHMVGVGSADTVIAINKDKGAPIFRQCDYGFVGDLKTVLPELTALL